MDNVNNDYLEETLYLLVDDMFYDLKKPLYRNLEGENISLNYIPVDCIEGGIKLICYCMADHEHIFLDASYVGDDMEYVLKQVKKYPELKQKITVLIGRDINDWADRETRQMLQLAKQLPYVIYTNKIDTITKIIKSKQKIINQNNNLNVR